MNYGGVCRTAPATPGPLINLSAPYLNFIVGRTVEGSPLRDAVRLNECKHFSFRLEQPSFLQEGVWFFLLETALGLLVYSCLSCSSLCAGHKPVWLYCHVLVLGLQANILRVLSPAGLVSLGRLHTLPL